MEKETKGDMSGGKGTLWMVVIFLLVVGGGFLAVNWDKIQERGRRFIETGSPLSLLQEKDSVEREGTTQDGVYRKKISEGLLKENGAFKGKGPQGAGVPQDGDLYGSLQKEVALFCDYLDHQAYVESYRLEGGVYDTLLRAITLLSRNPPVISGETRDVYILMKNTAHFYRELKGKRIALAKAVLNEEKEAMEPLFELLYAWIMAGVQERNPEIRTSLKDLYIYASFFLETLGGKAYLARRDSRTRILVKYYSILILDEADRKGLNRYGIDILPQAALLVDDISNQKGLEYRDRYLGTLKKIEETHKSRRS